MSDRLISAETLLTKYQELCEGLACIDCPFYGLDNGCGLESMILQEQIVDAEPVVRCKDCKYYSADGWGYGNCYRRNVDFIRMNDNGFCSMGERREDGNNDRN